MSLIRPKADLWIILRSPTQFCCILGTIIIIIYKPNESLNDGITNERCTLTGVYHQIQLSNIFQHTHSNMRIRWLPHVTKEVKITKKRQLTNCNRVL